MELKFELDKDYREAYDDYKSRYEFDDTQAINMLINMGLMYNRENEIKSNNDRNRDPYSGASVNALF